MSKETKVTASLSKDELATKATELETQLFKLRMQKATGQLGNTALIRFARKDLARVRTFQTQKAAKKAEKVVRGK